MPRCSGPYDEGLSQRSQQVTGLKWQFIGRTVYMRDTKKKKKKKKKKKNNFASGAR